MLSVILWTIALPFLVWLWLGVAFVIISVILCWMKREFEMEQERARIIRYTTLDEPSMPGLLSFFEEEKNILHIDRALAAGLPNFDRERLEMTTHTFTRKASANEVGMAFKPYVTLEVMQAAQ